MPVLYEFHTRGGRLLQTSLLIGQEVQLSSSCPIRMLDTTNNNALIGKYYTMFANCPYFTLHWWDYIELPRTIYPHEEYNTWRIQHFKVYFHERGKIEQILNKYRVNRTEHRMEYRNKKLKNGVNRTEHRMEYRNKK